MIGLYENKKSKSHFWVKNRKLGEFKKVIFGYENRKLGDSKKSKSHFLGMKIENWVGSKKSKKSFLGMKIENWVTQKSQKVIFWV